MAENNDALMAYAMGQDNGRCNNGGGLGGWGGFGGGYGGGGAYPVESILQRSLDTQTIIGKLDGVTQGLCDGFYATQNSINGLGTTVMQTASQAELARCQQQAALMQQLYNMSFQDQQCCCETQRSIDSVKFTIAQEDCNTRNLMQSNTRDLIENQNANARAVLDALTAQRLEAKDERIAAQAAQIQALQLAASQANLATDTIKNINKICMLEEEGGYSSAVDGMDYGRGSSYANRGKHYVQGHYSRDGGMDRGGYSSRRDSRGRYSRDDGRSEMMEHLEMAMDTATDQDRETIKRFMRQLENA